MKTRSMGQVGRVAPRAAMFVLAILVGAAGAARGVEPSGVYRTEVTLDDAGEAPRQELRYQVEPGTTERMEIVFDAWLHEEAGGRTMELAFPRIVLTAQVQIDRVAGGEIHVSGRYRELEIHRPQMDGEPVSRELMEDIFSALVGAVFSGRLSDRGVVLESHMELPEKVDPVAASVIKTTPYYHPLLLLVTPLPRDAVGTGARWSIGLEAEWIGVTYQYEGRSMLQEPEDGVVTIERTLAISAADEAVEPSEPDVRDHLIRAEGEAESVWQIGRGRLSPVDAATTEQERSELERTGPAGRVDRELETEVRYHVRAID